MLDADRLALERFGDVVGVVGPVVFEALEQVAAVLALYVVQVPGGEGVLELIVGGEPARGSPSAQRIRQDIGEPVALAAEAMNLGVQGREDLVETVGRDTADEASEQVRVKDSDYLVKSSSVTVSAFTSPSSGMVSGSVTSCLTILKRRSRLSAAAIPVLAVLSSRL